MIEMTPELRAFLGANRASTMADLYTFVLTDGTVVRWTDADRNMNTPDGRLFRADGPSISRGGIKLTRGIQTDTLSVTLTQDETVRIAGRALVPFIVRGGLDGAEVMLERAFMPMGGGTIVGTIVRFVGNVGQIDDADANEIPLSIVGRTHLLNTAMPADLFQRTCLNTVYDHACGLNRADWAVAGMVMGTPTARAFSTNLVAPAGYFALGPIRIGGVTRTIKTFDEGGNITLALPLPAVPSAGTEFVAWPGCDRLPTTCENKFDNNVGSGRNRFRGQPYIPIAETAV